MLGLWGRKSAAELVAEAKDKAFDAVKDLLQKQSEMNSATIAAKDELIRELVTSHMVLAGRLTAQEADEARISMNPRATASAMTGAITGPAAERIEDLERTNASLSDQVTALMLAREQESRTLSEVVEGIRGGRYETEGE